MVGRAAERPPLARLPQRTLVRALLVAVLGTALEAGVALAFWATEFDEVALAAAIGVLIAVLAGAVGGPWAAPVVAAAGWTLQFFLVVDESWIALAALPAWLAAALEARERHRGLWGACPGTLLDPGRPVDARG